MTTPDPLTTYLATHNAPCPNCGYNLKGLKTDTCPECGRILQHAELAVRKPPLATAFLDTLWIVASLALALVACFSLLHLIFFSRSQYFVTILLNALMGGIGGVLPLLLRRHGRAWAEPCRRQHWKANAIPLLLTPLSLASRVLALIVLRA